MQRGVLNSTNTGITAIPSREMDYTLDGTGNWTGYLTKTSGTTDLSQTRTANTVNELTAISSTPGWVNPAYDAAGNMTTMPYGFDSTFEIDVTYDAWNRMTSISNSGETDFIYSYDGRNRRIIQTDGFATRHFYFTNSWQDIEERIDASTTPDTQYVWGIRYIDELVCRDDATPQRLYACQDANFNLTNITDVSGTVQERYLFDPYSNQTVMDASYKKGWTPKLDIQFSNFWSDGVVDIVPNDTNYMGPSVPFTSYRSYTNSMAGIDHIEIDENDIVSQVTSVSPVIKQTSSAHEFGHMLGLDHPGQDLPNPPKHNSIADYAADATALMGMGMQMRKQYYEKWRDKLSSEYPLCREFTIK